MGLGSRGPGSSHKQSKCKRSSQVKRQCLSFVEITGLNTVGSIKSIIWIPSHFQQRPDGWQRRYMAKSQSNSKWDNLVCREYRMEERSQLEFIQVRSTG